MFKIGDIVEVVKVDCRYSGYHVGDVLTVSDIEDHGGEFIKCNGMHYGMYAYRFKLYKEKQMKLKDIIQPFMRVRTRSEGMWIAVEQEGKLFIVKDGGFIHIRESGEYALDGQPEFDTVEVFEAPHHVADYLDSSRYGCTVWKLPIPKSPQQIAIENLEDSIKASQDKLEELKRTL